MIIGISGKKQCGKNTIADIINEITYYKYSLESFAYKLKKCASIILGTEVSDFEYECIKDSFTTLPLSNSEGEPMTNREFLQVLGTEVGRNINKDLWVMSLMSEYDFDLDFNKRANISEPMWIITDVRFESEAKAIKDRGGLLIRVNRNTGLTDTHISETALDDYKEFDYVIDNNGTAADLHNKVFSILSKESLIVK